MEQRLVVAAPLERLRDLFLDELPRVASFMPHVERVDPLSARWFFGQLEHRDRWLVRRPAPRASGVLLDDALVWTVRARWSLLPCVVTWELERRDRTSAIAASGLVQLAADGPRRTRVVARSEVRVGLETKVTRAAQRGASKLEHALGDVVRQNVVALFEAADSALVENLSARPWMASHPVGASGRSLS
jgi:hypothetical protein